MANRIHAQPQYFKSPQEAVQRINDLLKSENYIELTGYYDLSDKTISPDSLTSGKYFFKKPHAGRDVPGGFGKFSKPFPLGFKYFSHELEGGFIRVTVHFEINQGDGMVQRAVQYFYLKEQEKGYQLVAD